MHKLRVKEWKKVFQANGNQKKVGTTVLISDKIDSKLKKDKEGPYII